MPSSVSKLSEPQSGLPARSGGPTGAVDSHFHVFLAGAASRGARYRPAYSAPFERWDALATASGVPCGVLVQTSFMGTDNRELLGLLAQHGERLRGVAVVASDVSADQLDHMHALGVRGVRLNLVGASHAVSIAPFVWAALERLGWHLEVHTDAGRLAEVLVQLPRTLPVVVDHGGKPVAARLTDATVQAVQQRCRLSPLYIKLSGAYRQAAGVDAGELARLWLHELGAQRLLWGSDWPCTNHEPLADYPALRRALDVWLDDPQAVQAALEHNPAELYWQIDAKSTSFGALSLLNI